MPAKIFTSIGRIARIAIALTFATVLTPVVAGTHGLETAGVTQCATLLASIKRAIDAHRIDEAETALKVSASACVSATPEEKRDVRASDIEFG